MKTALIRTEEKTNRKADWQFDSLLDLALELKKKI